MSDLADKIANRVLQAEVRAALESLESQNQALQEENERLRSFSRIKGRVIEGYQGRMIALQERIDKTRRYVTESGAVMMNTPTTWHGFVDEILNLLFPTEETDPEMSDRKPGEPLPVYAYGLQRQVQKLQERSEKAEARVAEVEQAVRNKFGPQAELILPTEETDPEMSDETLAQKLTGRKDGTPEQAQEMVNALAEAASLAESQNQALRERIEELTVGLNEAIGHLTFNEWKHDASSRRRTKAVKEATGALSPTQETDPKDNARCPSCRCAEGDSSPCPDIDCPDRWHAQETDPE